MKAATRRLAWGIALAATAAAVVFAPPPDDGVAASVEPARPERSAAREREPPGEPPAESSSPRILRADVPPIFQVTTWVKPAARAPVPKAEPAPPVPQEPQVPSIPFRIVGRFVENGVTGMFVQYNDRTLVARAGDLIGEAYKVESIADQTMTVVYLPMNVTQTISSGVAN
jgi:hypothetical protein